MKWNGKFHHNFLFLSSNDLPTNWCVSQHCGVTVRGSWYLPPSRHHCQGYSPNTPTKRRRQFGSPSRAVREYHDFSCPLEDCARQCDSKKLLMLHLAIAHYMPELEELYINGQSHSSVFPTFPTHQSSNSCSLIFNI